MKNLVTTGLLSIATLLSAGAASASSSVSNDGNTRSFVGQSYNATCRNPYPLTSYDGCNAYTEAGLQAAECAIQQALVDCQSDYNSDCVVDGVTYQDIVSMEFIGFKACQARVHVHGFRLAR